MKYLPTDKYWSNWGCCLPFFLYVSDFEFVFCAYLLLLNEQNRVYISMKIIIWGAFVFYFAYLWDFLPFSTVIWLTEVFDYAEHNYSTDGLFIYLLIITINTHVFGFIFEAGIPAFDNLVTTKSVLVSFFFFPKIKIKTKSFPRVESV